MYTSPSHGAAFRPKKNSTPGNKAGFLLNLWIRRDFALGVFLLSLLAGSTFLAFQPVRYTARSELQFFPEYLEVNSSADILRTPVEPAAIDQEILAEITSDEFLLPLISKHGFDRRAAFNPSLHPDTTLLTRWLESLKTPTNLGYEHDPEKQLAYEIAKKIRKDISIEVSQSNVITFTFTSVTADLSAKVVNAIAESLKENNAVKGRKNIRTLAKTPETFSEPYITKTICYTALAGLFLGISLAYLLTCIQTRITRSGACTEI